jgi:hypothetical protein
MKMIVSRTVLGRARRRAVVKLGGHGKPGVNTGGSRMVFAHVGKTAAPTDIKEVGAHFKHPITGLYPGAPAITDFDFDSETGGISHRVGNHKHNYALSGPTVFEADDQYNDDDVADLQGLQTDFANLLGDTALFGMPDNQRGTLEEFFGVEGYAEGLRYTLAGIPNDTEQAYFTEMAFENGIGTQVYFPKLNGQAFVHRFQRLEKDGYAFFLQYQAKYARVGNEGKLIYLAGLPEFDGGIAVLNGGALMVGSLSSESATVDLGGENGMKVEFRKGAKLSVMKDANGAALIALAEVIDEEGSFTVIDESGLGNSSLGGLYYKRSEDGHTHFIGYQHEPRFTDKGLGVSVQIQGFEKIGDTLFGVTEYRDGVVRKAYVKGRLFDTDHSKYQTIEVDGMSFTLVPGSVLEYDEKGRLTKFYVAENAPKKESGHYEVRERQVTTVNVEYNDDNSKTFRFSQLDAGAGRSDYDAPFVEGSTDRIVTVSPAPVERG